MVNVYLRDEIEAELIRIAQEENEELKKLHRKPDITKGKIAARIIEDWYVKQLQTYRSLTSYYNLATSR